MEYSGLTGKYPVDRRITRQECDDQLHQKQHLDIEPAYQLSVIRMNSTYLELVDKYFGDKGSITTFMGSVFLIITVFFGAMFIAILMGISKSGWLSPLMMFLVMGLPGYFFLYKGAHYEAFAYTHYPIRFNRKTRMVHVFRLNGTVLSVPWDEVFFCMAALPQRSWEIQGHVMAPDGVTVRETFPLTVNSTGALGREKVVRGFWELVRRYMEEGPEDAYHRVGICMDVADKYETAINGFHRMHVEGTGNIIAYVLFAAFGIILLPGRYIAMRTSKIPQWPQEIEAVNVVEPNDPYFRDASMNPKD
jgi:hypothetical protein